MAARMIRAPLLSGFAAALLLGAPAAANDLPVNVPANAAASAVGNLYVWAEGPWGPVRPPVAGQVTTLRVAPDTAANEKPPTGWDTMTVFGPPSADSMRGGIGYVFPDGTFGPSAGSRARIEVGASQTSTSIGGLPGNHNALVGTSGGGLLIGGCTGCTGSVSTNYVGKRTSVKAASDYNVHGVTLTPSVSIYSAENTQDFSSSGSADASGSMRWKDSGAAIGLESKVELLPALTLNVGGNVGVANREASLAPSAAGALLNHRNGTPMTGNAEARLTYNPATELELNSFAGVRSYDSALPGISVTQGNAPQIKYGPDAGYYVGAGATYRFGTKD